jgi:acyl-CoA thioester hydrolase
MILFFRGAEKMKRKIYYYDTDCGGVVYHANYLRFYEEARTAELEEAGLTVKQLMKDGCYIVVSHQEIFYKYPAFYGDELEVSAKAVELTPVRLIYEYHITKQDGRLINYGTTTLVSVDKQGAPAPWPPYVAQRVRLHPKTINVRKPV